MEDSTEVFKSSFGITYGFTIAWTCGVSGVIIGMSLITEGTISSCMLQCMAASMAIGGVFAAISIVLAIAYFKIYVHTFGMTLYDIWGRYHDVKWNDITRARIINFIGLRYVLIESSSVSRTLWLPLFLSDQERFAALVARHIDSTNPLAEMFS